jgi:hypothetical protein|tara:strand:+ start:258 stop:524 length:267 start_codon:yes stop_codon:yes gene_type:complete
MNKEKVIEQLPNWFRGEVYELGDEVRNPYSGETVLLDAAELSMYDAVKGAEMIMLMGFGNIDECVDIINQGKDWMLAKNPNAYMKLLD